MFATNAAILQRIMDVFQVTALPAGWASTIVPDCHARAYGDIVSLLSARGYLPAQIAAWDRGLEFEQDLALYYALMKGASLFKFDPELVKTYDRRGELCHVNLTAAGVFQAPQGTAGLPAAGEVSEHEPHGWPWRHERE